ncbi:CPBP family intramembrane glutamic endopeptidase [Pelosinus sp. sgz500959]|uniref:CPBP family intramembrane glutamic endopeptidase n=1 Tax=Pelosinus sp. sgz500959 TaxID=3242472 RepID=UPI00366C9335
MVSGHPSWNLTAVFSIHILRLAVGLLLVRFLYPLFFQPTPFIIEVTDRMVIIGLVWLGIGKCRKDFKRLGLSLDQLRNNILKGLAAGLVLLAVSMFSERIAATMLFAAPTQHPLVLQVENATTWQQLIIPLFLAGFLAPVSEELLYRLFTFLPMQEHWGVLGGAFASSLVFALMHFNLYWLGEMIIVGMGLAFIYHWTGSLISGMIAHSVINTLKILMLFFNVTL